MFHSPVKRSIGPPSATFFAVFVLILFNASLAGASGFAIYTHGAKELGMLASTIAHTEGPASNFYNPALITRLPGVHMEAGVTYIEPGIEFESQATGIDKDSEYQNFWVPTAFFTWGLTDDFFLGFGAYSPFGLGTKWSKTPAWEGRYIATTSLLETYGFNFNAAYKLPFIDKLSVALGFVHLHGKATFERNVNPALYGFAGLPDIESKFDADGSGQGWNAGVHYQFSDDLAFGMSYRSKIDLDLDGDLEFKFPMNIVSLPAIYGETELRLPSQWFGGVSWKLGDFLFEAGGKWEEWSRFEKIEIKTDQPVLGSYIPPVVKDWDDVWGINFGVRYDFAETMALSLGYIHEWNPVPDETFDPQIPSSDKNIYSIGFQKHHFLQDNLTFAITYMYETYNSRNKDNDVGAVFGGTANGNYDQYSHLVSTSITFSF